MAVVVDFVVDYVKRLDTATLITVLVVAVSLTSLSSALRYSKFLLSRRRFFETCLADFPGAPKHWLLGHLDRLTPNEEGIQKSVKWTAEYKFGYPLWFGPFVGMYECAHPMTVKAVLSTAEPKDEWSYGFVKPWLGDGLLLSKGPKWMRNRKLLSPGFHFEILKPYAKIFKECADVLVDKWSTQCTEGSMEMFHPISLMTLDSLMKCIFSLDVNCQTKKDSHPYIKDVYDIANLTIARIFNLFHHADIIYKCSSNGRHFYRALHSLHSQSMAVIDKRKKALEIEQQGGQIQKRKYIDFLDILLSAKDEDGKGLTDQEIRDEVDTFMFEGHDTTASAISWCLYNLAKNPEHQKKCQDEIDNFFAKKGNTDIEWDDLNSVPYLTLCIKESFRITPPVPSISRKITKRVDLPDGRAFLPGMIVTTNFYALHHNIHVWDNPDVYDPSRFLPENVNERSPYAFVPFSAGPRNCVGQNFAMNEMKITLMLVLHSFEFSLDKTKPPSPKFAFVYRSENGIHLHVKKRHLATISGR
ncbi:cytochrome P450 4F4-like [Ptychodera flava]|uniref:cytochrome P450 4F4-like n=1 Tax=Ptychodera flava TaxID=63121 RepID=UPI00396A080E